MEKKVARSLKQRCKFSTWNANSEYRNGAEENLPLHNQCMHTAPLPCIVILWEKPHCTMKHIVLCEQNQNRKVWFVAKIYTANIKMPRENSFSLSLCVRFLFARRCFCCLRCLSNERNRIAEVDKARNYDTDKFCSPSKIHPELGQSSIFSVFFFSSVGRKNFSKPLVCVCAFVRVVLLLLHVLFYFSL